MPTLSKPYNVSWEDAPQDLAEVNRRLQLQLNQVNQMLEELYRQLLETQSNGSGGGAPTDATYITQTASSDLSAEQALGSLSTGVLKVTTGSGTVASTALTADSNDYLDGTGNFSPLPAGAADAPANATYIVQTANAGLSAEQALSGLSTGVMLVANGTGVISSEPLTAASTDYLDGTGNFTALPAAGAPANATYITQTAAAGLSAEQALSSLSTGIMKVANGTGAVTSTALTASSSDYLDGTGAFTALPSGGITQLTGDVTAGPGSGSQAATIGNDKVTTAKILNANVTTAKIADDNVTFAKIQNITASRLLGRDSSGGDVQEIDLGTNLSLTGTTLNGANQNLAGVQTVSGTLTDTQIKAMFAAPIVVVAAAAGFTHFGISLELSPNFSAGVYATGGNINIYRGAAAPNPARMGAFSAGTMNSATKRTFRGFPLTTTTLNVEDDNANSANQPLVFSNATAAYTGGNAANTVVYKFTYVTVVSP